MKRFTAVLLLALSVVLSACEITVHSGDVPPTLPQMRIYNPVYATNYQANINGADTFIICNNQTTLLRYAFDYSGRLESWSSYVWGQTTGDIRGEAFFDRSDIAEPGHVEVSYTIPPFMSPLSVDEGISAQGIIIVPKAKIIGYSELFVKINGSSHTVPLSSKGIPVVDNCP
jgi:mRNA degradation ribonuclease J1/J2